MAALTVVGVVAPVHQHAEHFHMASAAVQEYHVHMGRLVVVRQYLVGGAVLMGSQLVVCP